VKVEGIRHLVDAGLTTTDVWRRVEEDVREAISGVVWPPGNDRFVINPVKDGNGVIPIKKQFAAKIEARGWRLEEKFPKLSDEEARKRRPGDVDAAFDLGDREEDRFFVEWETGNISSSHRAMNKMALALKLGLITGGMWVVPSGSLAYYLTDRIGNYPEFEPYFGLYSDLDIEHGYLGVAIVEHDEIRRDVPFIPKQKKKAMPGSVEDEPDSEQLF